MITLYPNHISSFWSKIDRSSEDGCWNWIAYKSRYGYGRLGTANNKVSLAHRVSWMIHNGNIPEDQCVLHKCDNTGCVNPDHLFLGTQADNMHDMKAKRRAASGENHSHVKLNETQVRVIRAYLGAGITGRKLAEIFGRSDVTISDIKRRTTWSHI